MKYLPVENYRLCGNQFFTRLILATEQDSKIEIAIQNIFAVNNYSTLQILLKNQSSHAMMSD